LTNGDLILRRKLRVRDEESKSHVPEWTGPFDIEIDCIAMA
jgi:hypothetical protein